MLVSGRRVGLEGAERGRCVSKRARRERGGLGWWRGPWLGLPWMEAVCGL